MGLGTFVFLQVLYDQYISAKEWYVWNQVIFAICFILCMKIVMFIYWLTGVVDLSLFFLFLDGDEADRNPDTLKSEISLVHEIALKRNMHISFEVNS